MKNSVPLVLTPHGELGEWHLRHKAWKKRIYMRIALDRILRNAATLHAITLAEKERVIQLGYDTPVTIAPNGIDPDPFVDLPDLRSYWTDSPHSRGHVSYSIWAD